MWNLPIEWDNANFVCDIFITVLLTLYAHKQISHKPVQRCLQVLGVSDFMTVVSSSFLESQ